MTSNPSDERISHGKQETQASPCNIEQSLPIKNRINNKLIKRKCIFTSSLVLAG